MFYVIVVIMKSNRENLAKLRRKAGETLGDIADAYYEHDFGTSDRAIERYKEIKEEISATETAIVIESSRATRRAQELAEDSPRPPSLADIFRDMISMRGPQQTIKDLLTDEIPDIPKLSPRNWLGIDTEDLFGDRKEKIISLNIFDDPAEKLPIDLRDEPIVQPPNIDDYAGLLPTPPFELPEEIIPPKFDLSELFPGGPSPLPSLGQLLDYPFDKFGFGEPLEPPKDPFGKFRE